MRFLVALLLALGLAASANVMQSPTVLGDIAVSAAEQQPSGEVQVDVDTDGGGGTWWMSPIWIGIGVVALIAVIALIAAAFRGGGTTVVKD